jgi:hypothetical protein
MSSSVDVVNLLTNVNRTISTNAHHMMAATVTIST